MRTSVINAVFNRAATVGQAIDSILSQTQDDIELLVQDGGSTNGALEVLQRIDDPRPRLLLTPPNDSTQNENRLYLRMALMKGAGQEGASLQRAARVDFAPRVLLEFRRTQLSSEGGLLVMRELDDTLGFSDLETTLYSISA